MSRPPMNLIFPDRTASGISKNSDGQRIIASTRRPDGTFRQEIKIRPGFTPQEDVSLFRSSKQVEMDQHRLKKGSVPGLKPNALVQDALRGATASKSAKKNAKRKDKRNDLATGATNEAVKDSWDDDGEEIGDGKAPTSSNPPAEPKEEEEKEKTARPDSTEATATEDPAKRLRNLRKKLKQTQQLKEKLEGGGNLGTAEQDKVDGLDALEQEIAKLELSSSSSSSQ